MVKYKNKNLKITLSLVVSTMSIVMANCMEDQGSRSSSSNAPAASGSSSSNAPTPGGFVTDHLLESINNQNGIEAQVRQLQGANDDSRDQLGVQQSVPQELLELRGLPTQHVEFLLGCARQLTEHSGLIVDLMRHIEDLNRHRVQDTEGVNTQLVELRGSLLDHMRQLHAQRLDDNRQAGEERERVNTKELDHIRQFTQVLDHIRRLGEYTGGVNIQVLQLREDLLNHIRQLTEHRLDDRRQVGELENHIRQLSIDTKCFGLVAILSMIGIYTYYLHYFSESFYSK